MNESTTTPLRLLAPAKINLHLRVGPLRRDGFHSLLSWFVTVGLFDTLTLKQRMPTPMHASPRVDSSSSQGARPGPAPLSGKETMVAPESGAHEAGVVAAADASVGWPAQGLPVELTCDPLGLPCDDRNLVVRAARAFAAAIHDRSLTANNAERSEQVMDTFGLPRPGSCGSPIDRGAIVGAVSAALVKRIPVGAGLGGGSSDAARALLGFNALWRAGWPASDLSALAATLGSDLPFFITGGGSAIVSGRGEFTEPCLAPLLARWAVLILSDVPMPTGPVYRKFDEMGLGAEENLDGAQLMKRWPSLSSEQLLPLLVNDLEPAAFSLEPRLNKLRNEATELLGRVVRMSGSGSSLFTLFDNQADATRAAERISSRFAVRTEVAEVSPTVADDLQK